MNAYEWNVLVRFFGGPLNEQVQPVRQGETVLLAPVPERVAFSLSEPMEPTAPAIRTVRYDIEKVGADIGPEPFIARVAVAAGYPRHRITDEMNTVLELCRWPWSIGGA